jgi:hypothetical protein
MGQKIFSPHRMVKPPLEGIFGLPSLFMSRKYIKKMAMDVNTFALNRSLTNPLKLAKVYRQYRTHLVLTYNINRS